MRTTAQICLVTVATLSATFCHGQKSANHWFFGNKVALDFSTSNPTYEYGSAMVAEKSSVSISDDDGNLLFYSNGEKVWNRKHTIMANGDSLLGSRFCIQSSIVVKKPGSQSIYYLFTTSGGKDIGGEVQAVRYHIIDMGANNGLGKVISKNNILLKSTSEFITATNQENADGVWLLTLHLGKLYSYLVTSSGVQLITISESIEHSATGSIKVNPRGTYFAVPSSFNAIPISKSGAQLFYFDSRTGEITFWKNIVIEPFPEFGRTIVDVAFGYNDSFYLCSAGSPTENSFLAGLPSLFDDKRQSFFFQGGSTRNDLQLGPNGRIYYYVDIYPGSSFLYEVRCPNGLIDLAPVIQLQNQLICLPSFNESDFSSEVEIDEGLPNTIELCADVPYTFNIQEQPGATYNWSPPNSLSKTNIANPTLNLNSPGTYKYILTTYLYSEACDFKPTDHDTLSVVVSPRPQDPIIHGDELVCASEKGVGYTVETAEPAISYQWQTTNGVIQSGQKTSEINVDWGNASSGAVSVNVDFGPNCVLNTDLPIIIDHIPPFTIDGSPVVCPNVTDVEYFVEPDYLQYNWEVNGGTIVEEVNTYAKINWGSSNLLAKVVVTATDSADCVSAPQFYKVKIKTELEPARPIGMDSVCFNFKTGVPYRTSFTNGSVYTWHVSDGIVGEGNGSSKVNVDWPDLGSYKIWVVEESTTVTDFCAGASEVLEVTVFQDSAKITMDFVSVELSDDEKIEVSWKLDLIERVSDLVTVSRRVRGENQWREIARLNKNVSSFLDNLANPDSLIYEYKVEGFNKCDEGLETVLHNNILLTGTTIEDLGILNLSWNDYTNWTTGVDHYEVWRKLDDEVKFELINVTERDVTNLFSEQGKDGFRHVIRIKAKKTDENTVSWSNDINLNFNHEIQPPNVITPNGDGKNDVFEISNIKAYKNSVIKIYARDGSLVFSESPYQNNWDAKNLPAGTYYYNLITGDNLHQVKGWVQVIR